MPYASRRSLFTRPVRLLFALALALVPFLGLAPAPAQAASLVVSNLDDSGPGSLRQAIEDANMAPGPDTITFSLSGAIVLESTLPTIGDELTIDGAGQAITISGANAVRVLELSSTGTLYLNSVTIANGRSSSFFSGGVTNRGGTLTVSNSSFSGNSGFYGGAIFNANGGTVTVSSSTFSGNSASASGGAINNNGGTLTVNSSTFSGNSASENGGAILSFNGTVMVNNSTFSGNSASPSGGSIANTQSTLTVNSSTFSGNSASSIGGDILNFFGDTTLSNNILAHSIAGRNCDGTFTDGGGNMADDDSCKFSAAGSRNSVDPNLDPNGLQDNGGPTRTIALLPDSPALDAATAECPSADQRGVARPQGDGCDSGAFELEQASDTTAPAITISSPADGAVYLLGQSVAASYACQDEPEGSGLASCTGTVASGAPIDTASVGSHTFTVSASDNAGNTATASVTYQVAYPWSGFLQPVDNLPTVNSVKAGQAVPITFSLGGNYGLNILASGYPRVQQVTCDSGAPANEVEQTAAAGASGLSYDAASDTYTYVWKTQKGWAGTCRQLTVRLIDGSEHIAAFKFR